MCIANYNKTELRKKSVCQQKKSKLLLELIQEVDHQKISTQEGRICCFKTHNKAKQLTILTSSGVALVFTADVPVLAQIKTNLELEIKTKKVKVNLYI